MTTSERIEELERALTHARAVAEAERRRATEAEASARRAWQMAAWGGQRRRESDEPSP